MLWGLQNFELKIFKVFKIKIFILNTITKSKICIMFFYENKFFKKSFAQVLPVNGNIYFIPVLGIVIISCLNKNYFTNSRVKIMGARDQYS